jgi:hypothetical protein
MRRLSAALSWSANPAKMALLITEDTEKKNIKACIQRSLWLVDFTLAAAAAVPPYSWHYRPSHFDCFENGF